jgi:hypothetical protein
MREYRSNRVTVKHSILLISFASRSPRVERKTVIVFDISKISIFNGYISISHFLLILLSQKMDQIIGLISADLSMNCEYFMMMAIYSV